MPELDRQAEQGLRQEVILVCQLLYQKNLIAATDGNVSVRWGQEYLITTPSGVAKGLMRPRGPGGDRPAGQASRRRPWPRERLQALRASCALHLEAYRQRPDIRAVVHAHPPITTALTRGGVSLAPCVLPETLVTWARS